MTQYHSHGVTLSDNQKAKLARAFKDKSSITLRLSNHELRRNDELMLTKTAQKVSESNCVWCKCWCQVIKGIVSSCWGPHKVRGSEACEAPCEACEACEAHKKFKKNKKKIKKIYLKI